MHDIPLKYKLSELDLRKFEDKHDRSYDKYA